jgi:hypothetical protein
MGGFMGIFVETEIFFDQKEKNCELRRSG